MTQDVKYFVDGLLQNTKELSGYFEKKNEKMYKMMTDYVYQFVLDYAKLNGYEGE